LQWKAVFHDFCIAVQQQAKVGGQHVTHRLINRRLGQPALEIQENTDIFYLS